MSAQIQRLPGPFVRGESYRDETSVYVNPNDVTGLEKGSSFWRGESGASEDCHTIVHLRGGGSITVGANPKWVAEMLWGRFSK